LLFKGVFLPSRKYNNNVQYSTRSPLRRKSLSQKRAGSWRRPAKDTVLITSRLSVHVGMNNNHWPTTLQAILRYEWRISSGKEKRSQLTWVSVTLAQNAPARVCNAHSRCVQCTQQADLVCTNRMHIFQNLPDYFSRKKIKNARLPASHSTVAIRQHFAYRARAGTYSTRTSPSVSKLNYLQQK